VLQRVADGTGCIAFDPTCGFGVAIAKPAQDMPGDVGMRYRTGEMPKTLNVVGCGEPMQQMDLLMEMGVSEWR